MDKQLLDIIRTIIREDVHSVVHTELRIVLQAFDIRMDRIELEIGKLKTSSKHVANHLKEQDDKLDAILEAWQIQKVHREELNNHERRIKAVENRITVIS